MPTETRVITFTNAEIKEAIAHYCVKTGRLATYGGVTGLTFSNDGGLSATFQPTASSPVVTFKENEIAAAVLLHCKNRGIPIARRSIKSLQVGKDSVMLTLTMPS
jgi:hypothetical protein